jgi:hypothetical protein
VSVRERFIRLARIGLTARRHGRLLATDFAADDLNKRGITPVNGKRWQAIQVIRARRRLDLRWPNPGGLFWREEFRLGPGA